MSENKKYNIDKEYSFNVGFAQKYGLNESIILKHLIFWIEKNRANEKHFYDGFYWTYNSIKAFGKIFPFWTERQVLYILKNLEEKEIIKSDNYNKSPYDRTKWYTIIDKYILQFCQMYYTKKLNENDKNIKPIPYINTDNKLDKKTYIDKKPKTYNSYPDIKNYRDNVKIREQDYNTLIARYGKDQTEQMIDYLSNSKLAKGYKYKSDYGAINTWVVRALNCQEIKQEKKVDIVELYKQKNKERQND